jgi:hypothetical protein
MSLRFQCFIVLSFIATTSLAKEIELNQSSFINQNSINIKSNEKSTADSSNLGYAVNVHGLIRENGVRDPDKTYTHTLEDFKNPTLIAENTESNLRPFSVAWSQDMTTLYGISRNTGRSYYLFTIDPTTGRSTEIAPFSGLEPNELVSGITIDESDSCYVIALDDASHDTQSSLYTCNLSTGELTLVGSQTVAPDLHDIVATCNGKIYGTDANKEKLYSINKNNGAASLIGDLNIGNDSSFLTITYDRNTDTLYHYVLANTGFHTAFASVDKNTGQGTFLTDVSIYGNYVGAIRSTCPEKQDLFEINPGLNGSWYNPETGGQGFFIDVLADSNTFFLSWFTYENMMVDTTTTSHIGNPGNRWMTALGELGEGNTVDLTINNTSGGLFNDPASVESNEVGTMTVEFINCTEGVISFAFNNNDISGVIPIERIANGNVELCESFQSSVK